MKSKYNEYTGLGGWFDTAVSAGTEYIQFEKEKTLSKLRIKEAERQAAATAQQISLLERMKTADTSQTLPIIIVGSMVLIGGILLLKKKK